MRKAALAVVGVVGLVVLWSIQDIAVWQRFFESRQWPGADEAYQPWHQAFLFVLIVLAVAWVGGARGVWVGLSSYVLAYGGWADVFYYWLDLRPIPKTLPWLEGYHPLLLHPVTSDSLLAAALGWAVVVGLCGLIFLMSPAGKSGGSTECSSKPSPPG